MFFCDILAINGTDYTYRGCALNDICHDDTVVGQTFCQMCFTDGCNGKTYEFSSTKESSRTNAMSQAAESSRTVESSWDIETPRTDKMPGTSEPSQATKSPVNDQSHPTEASVATRFHSVRIFIIILVTVKQLWFA